MFSQLAANVAERFRRSEHGHEFSVLHAQDRVSGGQRVQQGVVAAGIGFHFKRCGIAHSHADLEYSIPNFLAHDLYCAAQRFAFADDYPNNLPVIVAQIFEELFRRKGECIRNQVVTQRLHVV